MEMIRYQNSYTISVLLSEEVSAHKAGLHDQGLTTASSQYPLRFLTIMRSTVFHSWLVGRACLLLLGKENTIAVEGICVKYQTSLA
jgi:hypothetical protein